MLDQNSAAWKALVTRWGITEHYWYPLTPVNTSAVLLAFSSPDFEERLGSGFIRSALKEASVDRVIEFGEDGSEKVLPLETTKFEYLFGLEAFWSSPPFDWIIYCSHESSITVGGTFLVDRVKRAWPDWHNSLW